MCLRSKYLSPAGYCFGPDGVGHSPPPKTKKNNPNLFCCGVKGHVCSFLSIIRAHNPPPKVQGARRIAQQLASPCRAGLGKALPQPQPTFWVPPGNPPRGAAAASAVPICQRVPAQRLHCWELGAARASGGERNLREGFSGSYHRCCKCDLNPRDGTGIDEPRLTSTAASSKPQRVLFKGT